MCIRDRYLTATTSWAAYVVDAPMVADLEKRDCRFGVRAVSPDGLQKSEISWSNYQTVAYNTPSTEVAIDRQVIKPNEQFKVYYEDKFAPKAQSFRLLNAQTGAQVGEKYTNCNEFTTSLAEVGVYDLEVVNAEGATEIFRGKVIISPEKTGACLLYTSDAADECRVVLLPPSSVTSAGIISMFGSFTTRPRDTLPSPSRDV